MYLELLNFCTGFSGSYMIVCIRAVCCLVEFSCPSCGIKVWKLNWRFMFFSAFDLWFKSANRRICIRKSFSDQACRRFDQVIWQLLVLNSSYSLSVSYQRVQHRNYFNRFCDFKVVELEKLCIFVFMFIGLAHHFNSSTFYIV